jgi:hypothetical protein
MILAHSIFNIDYWLYIASQKKWGWIAVFWEKKNQFCIVANKGMIHNNIWLHAKY